MRIGQIGILTKEFFKEKKDKWVYLTTAVDVSDYWRAQFPNKDLTDKTYYNLKYQLLHETDPYNCTVIYLGKAVVPDILMSEGAEHTMSSVNTKLWRYHKVLLTINDFSEVRFLHERCLEFFTWHYTD